MRIGIDAKWFFHGNPSGRVVLQNILKYLINISHDHELYIFLKYNEKALFFPFVNPRVHLVYVWGKNNQLSNIFVLPKHIKRNKLDVMLFFSYAPFFSSVKKIVFIFDVIFKSNPEYFTIKEKIYFFPIKFLAANADHILTISNSEKERLMKYRFGRKNQIDVIYLGVDQKFKPLANHKSVDIERIIIKYQLPEKFLLYVGRLNIRKNIPNLLKAIPLLKDKSIKLVLGGKCDRKIFNVNEILNELNITDRVIQLGYIDDDDLPILYSLASIFCYISFDEGFGLPPLESLASGVPVVISNVGSLPEICGKAGIYCNPFDSKDVANKIDTLLEDKNVYLEKMRLGLNISSQFNWEKSAKDILNIMNNLYYKN